MVGRRTTDQGVPGSSPDRGAVRCGLEQVTPLLSTGETQEAVDVRKTWTDCVTRLETTLCLMC